MRLFQADIHLYRARLFFRKPEYPWEKNIDGTMRGPGDDLDEAEKLIKSCSYHRRSRIYSLTAQGSEADREANAKALLSRPMAARAAREAYFLVCHSGTEAKLANRRRPA